jgi:hypothetical protein
MGSLSEQSARIDFLAPISAQWVGHSLRRLQLTDNARCKRHNDGPRYAIRRAEVLDLMRCYAVPEVEGQEEVAET